MDTLAKIADEIYRPSCGFSRRNVEKWVERVADAALCVDLTICNLKPLAYNLKCDPSMNSVMEAVRVLDQRLASTVDLRPISELLGCEPVMAHIMEHLANRQSWVSQRFVGQLVAQALNWERTEFDTLDELLVAIREQEQAHSNFVDLAIRDQELLDKVRDKLVGASGTGDTNWTLAIQEVGQILLDSVEPRSSRDDLVELDTAKLEALRSPGPHIQQLGRIKRPADITHTLLHAGELYREITILLHTEQLVAWRTADGQEYSAPAHQVLLDPDEDGLAAELLSRIAGVEIAPEHMAELRAQMTGGVK